MTEQDQPDLAVLAVVGRMYLNALDADPENEMLTLAAAYRVTQVREAVERQERRDQPEPCTLHGPRGCHGSCVGRYCYANDGNLWTAADEVDSPLARIRHLPDGSTEIYQDSGGNLTLPNGTWIKVERVP